MALTVDAGNALIVTIAACVAADLPVVTAPAAVARRSLATWAAVWNRSAGPEAGVPTVRRATLVIDAGIGVVATVIAAGECSGVTANLGRRIALAGIAANAVAASICVRAA